MECKVCKKEFQPIRVNQIYCSHECRNKYYRIPHIKTEYARTCSTCGKDFITTDITQKYCNKICRPLILIKYTLICAICKKEFKSNYKNAKTCSKECLRKLVSQRKYITKQKVNNKSAYNSAKDARLIVRPIIEDILGKSIGKVLDINGKSIDYRHIAFSEKTKTEILKRDKYKCRICNNEVNLHVHHIVPRQFGGSHDKDNLITLCAKCHMHIETGDAEHAIQKCAKNYITILNNKISKPRNPFSPREITMRQNEFIKNMFKRISNLPEKSTEIKEILCSIDTFLENIKIE